MNNAKKEKEVLKKGKILREIKFIETRLKD